MASWGLILYQNLDLPVVEHFEGYHRTGMDIFQVWREDGFFDVLIEVVVPLFGKGGSGEDVRELEEWKEMCDDFPFIDEVWIVLIILHVAINKRI